MNIWANVIVLWIFLLSLDIIWDGFRNQEWHQVYRDYLIRGLFALGIFGLYLVDKYL